MSGSCSLLHPLFIHSTLMSQPTFSITWPNTKPGSTTQGHRFSTSMATTVCRKQLNKFSTPLNAKSKTIEDDLWCCIIHLTGGMSEAIPSET